MLVGDAGHHKNPLAARMDRPVDALMPDWAYKSAAFDMPVDLAPTVSEANHRDWSSNTTLAELADIYVLNRGNNTITRMKVDGTVIATRAVVLPGNKTLGKAKLNGIATSMDGSNIYVTVTGTLPGYSQDGAVLELPAFTS